MEKTRTSMLRTRWAAIGAAVAVTLGGGGIGITHALTTSGEKPIYLPLDSPCRLADLRPAPFQVGPRSAPLGPNETYTLDGWGAEGDCNLPANTAGLELNVTALEATAATFLRFWPGDGAEPDTANLNPTPGQPPIPNSVTVGLSGADGTFKVFNKFGNVAVVIDVVGIYDDHNHDDRYYQKSETYTKAEVDGGFLAQGTIVLNHGTGELIPNASSTGTLNVSNFAGGVTVSGTGASQMSLTGVVTLGGVNYQLQSVEYCVKNFSGGAAVTSVRVYPHGSGLTGFIASDSTDRTTTGCFTLNVGHSGSQGYDLLLSKSGGGSFILSGVKSTWAPV